MHFGCAGFLGRGYGRSVRRDLDKARAWRQRAKALAPKSARKIAQDRERAKLTERKVAGKPCVARWDEDCRGMAVVLHEPLLRSRGGNPASDEDTIAVCAYCHDAIHRNPVEATARGLMRHAWDQS